MKKIIIILFSVLLFLSLVTSVSAEDFEGNENEYLKQCSGTDLTEEEAAICDDFQQYMMDKSTDLAEKKAEIDEEMANISDNIQAEVEKISGYDSQIASMQTEIDQLQVQIDDLNVKIENLKVEIENNKLEVEKLESKVEERMVASQPTMRLDVMIDFLMGADSFEDFIRRANGINAIADYEEDCRNQLAALIETLANQQEELANDEKDLETSKSSMIDQQNDIIALQYKAELVRKEYLKQYADLEALGNQTAGDLAELQSMQKELANSLQTVVSSSGFIRPVASAVISAGTWHYPASFGGGIHLGVDYAAPKGTTVVAPANGVIISSADGCPDGYLGSRCGTDSGGVAGGGNQIYMVCSVNGKTYGLRFFHFLIGSPIATGTIVNQGDKIAEVGTSGNSTGPHTHVEVIYLGTMSVSDYISSWNGSLSFNASYGSDAYYNHLCENGASAPCRIKPESVFE